MAMWILAEQVAESEAASVSVVDQPDDLVRSPLHTKPGVQRSLHVDMLECRPGLLDHGEVVNPSFKVRPDDGAKRRLLSTTGLGDEPIDQQPPIATHVGQLGTPNPRPSGPVVSGPLVKVEREDTMSAE